MFDFLKTLGEGILYTLLSPFILIILVAHMVVYVVIFFIMFIKRIIMFFQGKDMSIDSELDRAAKLHLKEYKKGLAGMNKKEEDPTPAPAAGPTTIVQPIIIHTTNDNNPTQNNSYQSEKPVQQERPKQDPIDFTTNTKEISYDELREINKHEEEYEDDNQ